MKMINNSLPIVSEGFEIRSKFSPIENLENSIFEDQISRMQDLSQFEKFAKNRIFQFFERGEPNFEAFWYNRKKNPWFVVISSHSRIEFTTNEWFCFYFSARRLRSLIQNLGPVQKHRKLNFWHFFTARHPYKGALTGDFAPIAFSCRNHRAPCVHAIRD